MKDLNVLIVGVGGQGTLLASRFLGAVAELAGADVKVSEVHGMSQRGGSVETCVKLGTDIKSPIIDRGEADVILSFEQLEAARFISYLRPQGTIIVNEQKINPMTVVSGSATYPENVMKALNIPGVTLISADALSVAEKCGTAKAVNMVLLGILCSKMKDVDDSIFLKALEKVVPPKFLEINKKAFAEGFKMGK